MNRLKVNTLISQRLFSLFALVFFFASNINAQDSDFETTLKYLKNTQPSNHVGIDSVLKPFEKDSIKMNRVLRDSKVIKYNEASS